MKTGSLINKSFRFRVYPSVAQQERLALWESAMRFLWNLALEQRKMGIARPRGERRYPKAFDQIKELTQLRAELPWLADVPCPASQQILIDLDKAWQMWLKRLAYGPRWKRRSGRSIGLREPNPKNWRISGDTIRFPKLGNLRAVFHRPIVGKPKICTLKRDGDQWFASVICEMAASNSASRTEPVVAIDRGITNIIADSDGRLVPNPKHLEKNIARIRRAQRTVSRRKKGSKNREKANLRVMRLHRKVRRQREHFLHVESSRYAKSHGVVVIEKLNVAGMKHGGLSGKVAAAGWSRFAETLDYKLTWSSGTLVEVPAWYSSQTCAACGCVDASSRSGERFCCTTCGHRDHADINAARVLLSRANRSALPVEATGSNSGLRSRKVRDRLRVPRRPVSAKSSEKEDSITPMRVELNPADSQQRQQT